MINANPSPLSPQPTSSPITPPPEDSNHQPKEKIAMKPPSPKRNLRYLISGALLLLLVIGGSIAFLLVRQSQDIRQQAAVQNEPGDVITDGNGNVVITCCRGGYNGVASGQNTAAAAAACTGSGGRVGPCVVYNDQPLACSPGATRCNEGMHQIVRCLDDGSGEIPTGQACGTSDNTNTNTNTNTNNNNTNTNTNTNPTGYTQNNPASIASGSTCNYNFCRCNSGVEYGRIKTRGEVCNTRLEITCYNSATNCSPQTNSVTDAARATCEAFTALYTSQVACKKAVCQNGGHTWSDAQQYCVGVDNKCYSTQDHCSANTHPCSSTTYSTQLGCQQHISGFYSCQDKFRTEGEYNAAVASCNTTAGKVWNQNTCSCVTAANTCEAQLGATYNTNKTVCENAGNTWSDASCTCVASSSEVCCNLSANAEMNTGESPTYSKYSSGEACRNRGGEVVYMGLCEGAQHGPCCINGQYKVLCGVNESPVFSGTKQQCEGAATANAGGAQNNAAGGANMCTDPAKSNQSVAQYVKFTCPNGCRQDSDGLYRCYENAEYSSTPLSLNGACGQVDLYTTANDWGSYCGYSEYNCSGPCQGTTQVQTPADQDEDVPENPPVGPICLNVSLVNTQGQAVATPALNQQVALSCGQVNGVSRYDFRLIYPDGTVNYQEGAGNHLSSPFTLTQSGKYIAQCRICTSVSGTTQCHDFESIAN